MGRLTEDMVVSIEAYVVFGYGFFHQNKEQ